MVYEVQQLWDYGGGFEFNTMNDDFYQYMSGAGTLTRDGDVMRFEPKENSYNDTADRQLWERQKDIGTGDRPDGPYYGFDLDFNYEGYNETIQSIDSNYWDQMKNSKYNEHVLHTKTALSFETVIGSENFAHAELDSIIYMVQGWAKATLNYKNELFDWFVRNSNGEWEKIADLPMVWEGSQYDSWITSDVDNYLYNGYAEVGLRSWCDNKVLRRSQLDMATDYLGIIFIWHNNESLVGMDGLNFNPFDNEYVIVKYRTSHAEDWNITILRSGGNLEVTLPGSTSWNTINTSIEGGGNINGFEVLVDQDDPMWNNGHWIEFDYIFTGHIMEVNSLDENGDPYLQVWGNENTEQLGTPDYPLYVSGTIREIDGYNNSISDLNCPLELWQNSVIKNKQMEYWDSETAIQNWTCSNISRSTDSDSGTYACQLSSYNTDIYQEYIAASYDDDYASPTMHYPTDQTVMWGKFSVALRGFLRWSLDIPYGATILSAVINVTCSACTGTFTSNISLFNFDDCPSFTTNPFSWSVTSDHVSWYIDEWTNNYVYTSPDISTIVQAFINRAGYSSGNHIGLRLDEGDAGTTERAAIWSFNQEAGHPEYIPILIITYQVGTKGYISQNLTEDVPVSSIGAFSFRYKHATSTLPNNNGIKATITYTDASTSNTGWLTPTNNWQTENLLDHLTAGKNVDSIKIEQQYDCVNYKPVLVDNVILDAMVYSTNVSGEFNHSITSYQLHEGNYTVKVKPHWEHPTYYDVELPFSVYPLTFTLDDEDPIVEITSPPDDSTPVSAGVVWVNGTFDGTGNQVTLITINDSRFTLVEPPEHPYGYTGTFSFKASDILMSEFDVNVTVKDRAGNTESATRHVVVIDTEDPIIITYVPLFAESEYTAYIFAESTVRNGDTSVWVNGSYLGTGSQIISITINDTRFERVIPPQNDPGPYGVTGDYAFKSTPLEPGYYYVNITIMDESGLQTSNVVPVIIEVLPDDSYTLLLEFFLAQISMDYWHDKSLGDMQLCLAFFSIAGFIPLVGPFIVAGILAVTVILEDMKSYNKYNPQPFKPWDDITHPFHY